MVQALGVLQSEYARGPEVFSYNAPGSTFKIFIASRKLRIVGIQGVTTVVGSDGSAVTASFYKCVDGVAAASGTLLHTGTYNLKGTVNVRQQLALTQDPAVTALEAGDTVAVIFTGTTTAAIGIVQIDVEPRD